MKIQTNTEIWTDIKDLRKKTFLLAFANLCINLLLALIMFFKYNKLIGLLLILPIIQNFTVLYSFYIYYAEHHGDPTKQ